MKRTKSDSPQAIDIVTRLRQTRADMIGTDDEQHYWDCHDAAVGIARLRAERDRWMHAALAHETVAAELRVRLMETPSPERDESPPEPASMPEREPA